MNISKAQFWKSTVKPLSRAWHAEQSLYLYDVSHLCFHYYTVSDTESVYNVGSNKLLDS